MMKRKGKNMKSIVILLVAFSAQLKAQEIKNYDRSDLTADTVLEMIYEEAWEVYTGDDGKECNSTTMNYSYTPNNKTSFKVAFEADQNGEYDYGCLVGVYPCSARFKLIEDKWKVQVTCEWY